MAWDITTGSSSVTVGVLDTGIDGSHPDLVNRINTSLCRDFTGVDENGTAVTPTDESGHGTQVAGLIGAQGNNSIGVSGVCWNVRLVSLQVFARINNKDIGFSSFVANAIQYAEEKGIDILNFSGSWSVRDAYYSTYYNEALAAVIRNYSGLFVCAAGNNESNNDAVGVYPANYRLPNLISVGASNVSDAYLDLGGSQGSNYGQMFVDIFAPGEVMLTTHPTDLNAANPYSYLQGTSAAAPLVTGVAALLLSKYPDLSPCEIKDTILSNVDDCGTTFDTLCVSGGRLNAYKALTNVIRHSFTYANKNSDSHTVTCTECNYSFVRDHTYTYTYTSSNLLTHTKCSYSSSEAHTWYTSPTNYRCTKCRLVTAVAPVNSVELPPVILAALQQLGANAVIAMDENTYLCQVDGQYYMIKSTTAEQALLTVLPLVNEAA